MYNFLSSPEKNNRPKRPCAFCSQLQTQLASILMRMHKDEPDVKQSLSLPRSKRLRKINNINKKGILSHNIALKREGKELLRERRQGCSETLAMWLGCKGFYSTRRIGKHKKVCEQSLGRNQGTLCANFLKETC